MVTTSTTAIASTTTIANNGMLLYHNNKSASDVTSCTSTAATTLEQYRLQLYNYALNMERLRGPPYTAAAAMAAAAAYASTTVSSTSSSVNNNSNFALTGQGLSTDSYLCASTTTGNLIATTNHMARSSTSMTQCPNTSNHLALTTMSLFPQRLFQPEEPKPQHSYIGLIAMAILNSAETKLVLSDIYQYILDNYPYFRTRGPGWRNSIRHNLSLNDCFIKSGRSANGKGHYWAIHPANMEDFRKGDFRRRKAQRKVRKHMGLAVDDNGTDSPSPPPAMDLTSPSPPTFQHLMMGNGGSTITPITTAAQHLAAQTVGWRFTQHHRQQHQHSDTGMHATASSYMGQIFSYRPQHYAAAAAAAAVALQNHPQYLEHHIVPSSLQQNPPNDTPSLAPNTTRLLSSQTTTAATNNAKSNVINQLFSQKRKRQFDVASLLAPDHFNRRDIQQQHQYTIWRHPADDIRPYSTSCEEDPSNNTNDLDIEDIDVVDASDDDDIENDYDEHDDDADSNSNTQQSYNRRSPSPTNSRDAKTPKSKHGKISNINCLSEGEELDETVIKEHNDYDGVDYEEQHDGDEIDDDDDDEQENVIQESTIASFENNNNNNNVNKTISNIVFKPTNNWSQNSPIDPEKITTLNSPPSPASRHLKAPKLLVEHNNVDNALKLSNQHLNITNSTQHHSPLPHPPQQFNAEAQNLFGRYYGTYMAAAAAARINSSSILTATTHNTIGNLE